jgi:Type I phosphodiesterase / nucleotide pyrophosphatase
VDSRPGLIVVQIDGMSGSVLDEMLSSGHMPTLERLVSSGELKLDRWVPLLPPCTPASQAGILHGRNLGIPGFRWYEKETDRLFVANHAKDAAEIEHRLSDGEGILSQMGVSVGNLLAGDAAFSHLTMATIQGPAHETGADEHGAYPIDPIIYVRIVLGMIRELLDEIRQARRQRTDDVQPRMPRGWRYALERCVTNVPLRILSTAVVIHEMKRGRPLIYVDYTGYDEISHHAGPGRPDTYGAAAKIDRSIGNILDAGSHMRRRYQLVVLSDHGQALGPTFRQRYGVTLVRLIAKLTGGGMPLDGATQPAEYTDGFERIRYHVLGPRLATMVGGLFEGRAGRTHHWATRLADSRGAPVAAPTDAQVANVVVCASGNLGLVYFTALRERMTREKIEREFPGLIQALVDHPGIGVVVVRSNEGLVAIGDVGTNYLDEGRITGTDPLAVYGPHAAEGLREVAGFKNSGDIIVIGPYDPATQEVVSFEELVGSHGGLGGPQNEAFIAYPSSWRLGPEPLVGAPAVNAQLRRWLSAPEQ